MAAPKVLLLDPERFKSIKKLVKFAKMLGQGGDEMRIFLKTVKPFTRTMRIAVGGWRWVEAAPCRRGEVGLEEFMVRTAYLVKFMPLHIYDLPSNSPYNLQSHIISLCTLITHRHLSETESLVS